MKGEALFGVPCGRGKAAWRDGDAENIRARTLSFFPSLGRSMIEMLGVLAIIGVLSAGGIWGYNVAVENARVNQLIDDISNMTVNARTFFTKYPKSSTQISISLAQLQQIGVVPSKYKIITTGVAGRFGYQNFIDKVKSPFGADMRIKVLIREAGSGWGKMQLNVELEQIPKSACVKLLTHNWKDLSARQLRRNSLKQTFAVVYCGSTAYCNSSAVLYPPVTPAKADEVCSNDSGAYGRAMVFHINLF